MPIHGYVVRERYPRSRVVRPEVYVRAHDPLQSLNVRVHNRATEKVQVEVVLRESSVFRLCASFNAIVETHLVVS